MADEGAVDDGEGSFMVEDFRREIRILRCVGSIASGGAQEEQAECIWRECAGSSWWGVVE